MGVYYCTLIVFQVRHDDKLWSLQRCLQLKSVKSTFVLFDNANKSLRITSLHIWNAPSWMGSEALESVTKWIDPRFDWWSWTEWAVTRTKPCLTSTRSRRRLSSTFYVIQQCDWSLQHVFEGQGLSACRLQTWGEAAGAKDWLFHLDVLLFELSRQLRSLLFPYNSHALILG